MPTQLALSDEDLSELSDFIAAQLGLHFPRERWIDLERGVFAAAREFDWPDGRAYARWLLSNPTTRDHIEVLAGHLTIGETYFFRERQSLEALEARILPELLRAREKEGRRLRIWCAGCSSGEEPYSVAMLLDRLIPDQARWNITILATDINPRSLRKAAGGVYGEWSFRGAPDWVRARYFAPIDGARFELEPEMRRRVTFSHLNLADDVYPSLLNNTNAMDLILCRNVLMYLTPPQARKVVANLHHALVEGGWLVVSAIEASHVLFASFVAVNFPSAILYRKNGASLREKHRPARPVETTEFVVPAVETYANAVSPEIQPAPSAGEEADSPGQRSPYEAAQMLYQRGLYAEAADALATAISDEAPEPSAFSLLARAQANLGNLAQALTWCDRWIAADKLNSAAHYLRAVVLVEQGNAEQARASMQRALYLHPDFVLAHFGLGNIFRSLGRIEQANRHYLNALRLLNGYGPDEPLPESDGLPARRLAETITSMAAMRSPP